MRSRGDFGGRGQGFYPGGFQNGLLLLLLAVLLVLGVVYLVQRLKGEGTFRGSRNALSSQDKTQSDPALHILREPLAKGKVEPGDYEARRRAV